MHAEQDENTSPADAYNSWGFLTKEASGWAWDYDTSVAEAQVLAEGALEGHAQVRRTRRSSSVSRLMLQSTRILDSCRRDDRPYDLARARVTIRTQESRAALPGEIATRVMTPSATLPYTNLYGSGTEVAVGGRSPRRRNSAPRRGPRQGPPRGTVVKLSTRTMAKSRQGAPAASSWGATDAVRGYTGGGKEVSRASCPARRGPLDDGGRCSSTAATTR